MQVPYDYCSVPPAQASVYTKFIASPWTSYSAWYAYVFFLIVWECLMKVNIGSCQCPLNNWHHSAEHLPEKIKSQAIFTSVQQTCSTVFCNVSSATVVLLGIGS